MHPGLLVFGGFLLGTVGVKAVRSRPAHKAAVRATVCGLQAKDYVNRIVDETKAECDDIMAEAQYIKVTEEAEREQEEVVVDHVTITSDAVGDVSVEKDTVVETAAAAE